jgi:predicted nuclease of predicted toxin-antitoxin system
VRILLDENLPRKLVEALRTEGHVVESVQTLRQHGIDNGRLYELARRDYDLCFTRDVGFAHNARQGPAPGRLKLVRVNLPQQRQEEFVKEFMVCFRKTDWASFRHGEDWPATDSTAL